ncbi:MAG TPA: SpoIIE family protein phosphatase [Candidatus Dormibacteraeota bacterium]|nr:SpoIIE family protein phosphatase [Candidatus Dormibacteraeota bacterium]
MTTAFLLVAFVLAVALIQASVQHMIVRGEAMRAAEIDRALVLRLQIDEETSLRGFMLTGDRSFLLPFRRARARLPSAFATLERRLQRLASPLVSVVHEQRALNERWITSVALPIVARRNRADRHALELQGKRQIDRFRELSTLTSAAVNRLADAADREASLDLHRILIGSGVLGVVLALALVFYAGVQMRLSRALSTQADEYERLRRIAAALQESFLVEPLPDVPNLSFDALYAPAVEQARVGGDWYGVFALPDGRVFFSMGDVAGHGVAAAVLMTRVRQTILSMALHERDPSVILTRANEVLRLRTETLVTALCGFIVPQTREISYASAGHPPPLLVTPEGGSVYLPKGGAPLGITIDPAARTFTRRASAGCVLVLYTDGITEFDRDVVRGEQRLRAVAETVTKEGGDRPAEAIVRRTLSGVEQRDDIAVLVVRFLRDASALLAEERTSETA